MMEFDSVGQLSKSVFCPDCGERVILTHKTIKGETVCLKYQCTECEMESEARAIIGGVHTTLIPIKKK